LIDDQKWEQACPTPTNDPFATNFPTPAADFDWTCITHSTITASNNHPSQLLITSTATPNHYTPPPQTWSPSTLATTIPLPPPPLPTDEIYPQNPGLQTTLGDTVIGYAINGIPFYSSLSSADKDTVRGTDSADHDICMGYTTTTDNIYHYKTAPPCLFDISLDKGQGKGPLNIGVGMPPNNYDAHNFTSGYGYFINGDKSDNIFFTTKLPNAPFVIGVALDGFLIYSPYDKNGELHTGLDNCNGKYHDGTYAYFATRDFPYIIGCFGPGIDSSTSLPATNSTALLAQSSQSTTSCSPGRYHSATLNTNHQGRHQGAGKCLPCPAGRYSPSSGGPGGFVSSQCAGECEEGYFCPAGSASPRQQVCGGVEFYCPKGATSRSNVEPG